MPADEQNREVQSPPQPATEAPQPAPSVGVPEGYHSAPESADQYEIAWREPVELGAEQAQMVSEAKEFAYAAGMPATTFAVLADIMQQPGENQTPEQCEDALFTMWGGNKAQRLEMAQDFVAEVEQNKPGLCAFLDRTGLGNNARFIAAVYELARSRRK
jgi:hypothetical protein